MAQGVARGENIADTNFKILGQSGSDIDTKQQGRFQVNYIDENTNFVFWVFKESPQFKHSVRVAE